MTFANQLESMTLHAAGESDLGTVRQLLEVVGLPTESIKSGTTSFYVAEENGAVVGIAGFEFYGSDALLRSVAVPPALQRKGIGDRIVDLMVSIAGQRGIKRIVLLTETAEKFFVQKGFRVVDRSLIGNEPLKKSSEFTYACPTSAVCMVLDFESVDRMSPT